MHLKNKHSIGIAFFRVFTCLIIIKNCLSYIPYADVFFGKNSIYPLQLYVEEMKINGLDFLILPFDVSFFPELYLYVVIILALLYLLAIGKRYIGVLLYFAIIILKTRNGFILDGSDNVIQVTLPFLVIADNLKHFRFFKADFKITPIVQNISIIAAYGLMIQVCFVYFFTALAKLQGDLWLNGTATYYTMRVQDFMATKWNIPLTENHYFVVLSTYFTVLWELSFPFLIWFRKPRPYIILGGVLLHIGIWIFMRIDNFSWVMISTYLVFITNNEYVSLKKYFLNNTLAVYAKNMKLKYKL